MMDWISTLLCFSLLCQSFANFVPYIKPGESEPSCAEGRTFCESIENYPAHIIRLRLRKYASVPSEISSFIFDKDLGGLNMATETASTFSHKLYSNASVESNNGQVEQLCRSLTRSTTFQAAKGLDNQWYYIVNIDNYEQRVEIETCKSAGANCSTKLICVEDLDSTLEKTYLNTRCEQVFRATKMLILDPSGQELTTQLLLVPSCCKCTLYS